MDNTGTVKVPYPCIGGRPEVDIATGRIKPSPWGNDYPAGIFRRYFAGVQSLLDRLGGDVLVDVVHKRTHSLLLRVRIGDPHIHLEDENLSPRIAGRDWLSVMPARLARAQFYVWLRPGAWSIADKKPPVVIVRSKSGPEITRFRPPIEDVEELFRQVILPDLAWKLLTASLRDGSQPAM